MFYFWTILSMLLLIGIDFISKQIVIQNMNFHQTIEAIPGVLHLYFDTNDGIGMSMLKGERWLFIPASILAVLVCVFILYKSPLRNKFWFSFTMVLIISGGIGNLIDRITKGEVVDFLQIRFIYFPYTFNVADCYVVLAMFILILLVLFHAKEYENTPLRTVLFGIPVRNKEENHG